MSPSHVVVDGSNIATEGRSTPSLKQLDEAIREFQAEFPDAEVIVVVDATFGHRIDPGERAIFDEAVAHGELVSPPAGAIGRGDAFVLRVAERVDAQVLSNDSFQEFHAEHPWLFEEGRLMGGKPIPGVGWIFTPRLPVRGPRSRGVTSTDAGTGRGRRGRTGEDDQPRTARARGTSKVAAEAIALATAEATGSRVAKASKEPAKSAKISKAAKTSKATTVKAARTPAKTPAAAKTTRTAKTPAAAKAGRAAKDSAPAAMVTKTARAAKEPARSIRTVDAARATVAAKSAGGAKSTGGAKAAKATKATKAAKATKTAKTTKKAKEPTESARATKPTKATKTSEKAEVVASRATKATGGGAGAERSSPPRRGRRGRGTAAADVRAAIEVATEEALSAPDGGSPPASARGRPQTPAAPAAVNDPLTFLTFVTEHPLGSVVLGTVSSFVSHGAMVDVDGMSCYLPLTGLGDPPPRRAREAVERGEQRSFVVVALDPPRRGAELALPGLARTPAPESAEPVPGTSGRTKKTSRAVS
jgi:hypothetical protein